MLTKKISLKKSGQIHGFLRWIKPSHTEQREIKDFISLGREESNMLCLDDDSASRRHCRIQKKDNEGFILQDMGSRNGTFLNGNKVFKAVLKNNDRIQLGKTEFIFSYSALDKNNPMQTKSKNLEWGRQLEKLSSIAENELPVLITGPSGTGKEILAQLIHRLSQRSQGPMVSVNCSALSESLIESEFFGHIRGSYTGALTNRSGAFLSAKGGTLFLDEIGDLPLTLQPKLLRALEYQEIKPVGADKTIKTDVRIVAATHQNLKAKTRDKTFRSDLFFRLNVLNLSPPALKDRMEDFEDFLNFFCTEYNITFADSAVQALKQYSWPGNIRELKNTIARAKALFSGKIIDTEILQQILPELAPASPQTPHEELANTKTENPGSLIQQIEKYMIVKALEKHQGKKTETAQDLDLPYSTLLGRLKNYNIDPNKYK